MDGCTVLCLAALSWRAIAECVPPVRQLLRDRARGRPFPACTLVSGNETSHAWSNAPSLSPPQYTRQWDRPNGPIYGCDHTGVISVSVIGAMRQRAVRRVPLAFRRH